MKTNRKPNQGSKNNGNNRGNGDKIAKYILVAVGVLLVLWAGKTVYDKIFGKKVVTAETALISPVKPDGRGVNAVIVLDCSSSMKGYADAYPNNYLDVLSDLRVFYPNTVAIINDSTVNGDKLIDRISNHQIQYTQQSLIDKDLAHLADEVQASMKSKANTTPLFFYITDGIMSGSDDQIRKMPNYNLIHAQDLQNQIKAAFDKKDSVGISVYQFKSRFKGVYYAFDNEHHPIDAERYFYVFAISTRPVLAHLKQQVDNKQNTTGFCFRPLGQWHAIDYQVINSGLKVGPAGAVQLDGDGYTYALKTLNATNGGQIEFTLPASTFSNYYLENLKKLAASSSVEVDDLPTEIKVKWDTVADAIKFNVPVSAFGPKGGTVKISIPRQKDFQWVQESSIEPRANNADKCVFTSSSPKTLLFRELMNGLQGGVYGAQGDLIYQKTINLKRQ